MVREGGCHCGAIRYRVEGDPVYTALCYCIDCRKSAGAPVVHWTAFLAERFALNRGELSEYASSPSGTRSFCPTCGTGIVYRNETALPGLVDVQAATLDDPQSLPPQIQVQTAERLDYMRAAHALPGFERFPTAP